MNPSVNNILTIINSYKFRIDDEIKLHNQIDKVLTDHGVDFKREHRLSNRDIVDFFIDGIALEIKIKGRPMPIYRQCERYCEHDCVTDIILATSKSMGLPEDINSKPAYLINLSSNLLT